MPLTDTQIRNAGAQAKPYKLPRELGLLVLVNPNGTKLWRLAYTYRGREKLLSLGAYPAVGLTLARKRRDEAHQLLAVGTDLSAHRQAENARNEQEAYSTFKAVAGRWPEMHAAPSARPGCPTRGASIGLPRTY